MCERGKLVLTRSAVPAILRPAMDGRDRERPIGPARDGLGPMRSRPDDGAAWTGKEGSVSDGRRVLVVDGLTETEEVLKAVLEPRGWQVDRIRRHARFSDSPVRQKPHLVVLHAHEDSSWTDTDGNWNSVPQIVIGSMQVEDEASRQNGDCRYFCNPFHYGELIQAIEQMLGS